jgi:putative addiction module killer protein
MKKYGLLLTQEFEDWLVSRTKKERLQIYDRFDAISREGYFGDHKSVTDDNSVWELRWVNGRRIYYSYLPQTEIIILLGGNKNGQKKDIARAERILSKKS